MRLTDLLHHKGRLTAKIKSEDNPNKSKELKRKLRNVNIYINHEGNSVSDDAFSLTNSSK